MVRAPALARYVLGLARPGGHRSVELQRIVRTRLLAGDTREEPGHRRTTKAGSGTLEPAPTASISVFMESRRRRAGTDRVIIVRAEYTGAKMSALKPLLAHLIHNAFPKNQVSAGVSGFDYAEIK